MADIAAHTGHAGHDVAHGHHPSLQHHFDTPTQQFEASKLGMWLFLATEVLFFSGLFCAYAIYRGMHPEMFMYAYEHGYLSVKWGLVNTIVLIASSFTMAMGVWCAQKSNQSGLVICLALTLLGACGFMVIKGIEYTDKYNKGKLWGRYYNPVHDDRLMGDMHGPDAAHSSPGSAHAPPQAPSSASAEGVPAGAATSAPTPTLRDEQAHGGPGAGTPSPAGQPPAAAGFAPERTTIKPPHVPATNLQVDKVLEGADGHHSKGEGAKNVHLFMGIYFCMTGLHGIHVLAGMVMLAWLLVGAIKGRYNAEYYTPVDLGGLYWHLVDLVWIYLFPLLYLIH